jgi:hypothetical protein
MRKASWNKQFRLAFFRILETRCDPRGKPIGPPLVHPDWVLAVALAADGRTLVTGCADRGLRVWKLPAAVTGTVERIRLWLQQHTGQELDAAGAVSLLDAAEWQQCRKRLRDLGGSLAP